MAAQDNTLIETCAAFTQLPASALLQDFADHLVCHRGNPPVTVRKRLTHIADLLEYLANRDKTWSTMALTHRGRGGAGAEGPTPVGGEFVISNRNHGQSSVLC
jgi:hypothetical protein